MEGDAFNQDLVGIADPSEIKLVHYASGKINSFSHA
jgi:hypothetical protein